MIIIHVKKYGLMNIARKIMGGALFFSILHSAAFWYAKYQIGGGDGFEAMQRKFSNFNSDCQIIVSILGFPARLINVGDWRILV